MNILKYGRKIFSTHNKELSRIEKENFVSERWTINNFVKPVKGKSRLSRIVFDKGKLVAYMIVTEYNNYMYLNRLVVTKKYQGKGVGAVLMNILEHNKKYSKVVLNVHNDNVRAIKFYKRLGYRALVTKKDILQHLKDKNKLDIVERYYPISIHTILIMEKLVGGV